MPLPKHHAEAGSVRLYEGYFYLTGFAGPPQGVEACNGEEEEASGACWGSQHHIRKRDQLFPTARKQAKSQRASKFGRPYGARQQVPNTWHWVRASARELIIHGRTSCCRQPATRAIRGRGDVLGCTGRACRSVSAIPTPWIRTGPNPVSHPTQPTGACLATCSGL